MTRTRVIAAIWLVVAIGILSPSLVGSRVFLGTDLLERFAPWDSSPPDGVTVSNPLVGDTVDGPADVLFQERLRNGDIAPLWNGYVLGGRPLASVPNSALYSPMNAPNWFLPSWYAPVISKIIELIAATGLMFLFLRKLGLTRPSALIAGFIYAFSGFQVVWTNWSQAHVGALIPGVFWGVELVLERRTLRSTIPLTLVVTVMWLEGFPAVTVTALLFAGAYALSRELSNFDWRRSIRNLALSLLGVLGSIALAAFQLIPFALFLRGLDLASRAQQPNWHLARRTLATLAVPNAFGSPVDVYYGPADYLIYGPVNYVEIQAFIGIAALALIAIGTVYGSRIVRRVTFWYVLAAVGFTTALMYSSGPLLNAVHALPLVGSNYVGRMRSILLFLLAVLAGIGFEALTRRLPSRATSKERIGVTAVVAAEILVVGWALQRAGEMAAEANRQNYLIHQVALAAIIAAAVLTLVATIHLSEGRLSRLAVGLFPIIIAVEITMFALPYWPQVPRNEYYPVTDTHRFLETNLGSERIASGDRTLYPSTTIIYKIRSVTAHSATPPEWGAALTAVDPDAFRFSATFTTLRSDPEIATSPILDRMAAAYFAVSPTIDLFGVREETNTLAPTEMDPGSYFDVPLQGRSIAGIELVLPEGLDPGQFPVTLASEIILSDETVPAASGYRRITTPIAPGSFQIAVPTIEDANTLRIRNDSDTRIVLASRPITVINALDDLPVAYAGGAVLYRRSSALPRIRWATSSISIIDDEERIATLAQGVDADTVVLSSPIGTAEGGSAVISVVEDEAADRIEIAVVADGPGFLVVADSMQSDWTATLDGEPIEIVPADHIGVAIPVSEGTHIVVFETNPSGWSLGLWISFLAAVGLVAVLAEGRRRSRYQGTEVQETVEPGS